MAQRGKGAQVATVDVVALVQEGIRLLAAQEPKKAEALFIQAVEQEPDKLSHQYHLGRSLLSQSKVDAAERCFERMMGLNSESHLGLYGTAQVALAREQWDAAIEGYRQLIAMEPKWVASVYQDLGSLLSKRRRWQESIECYQQLVQTAPNNYLYHQDLGNTLFDARQYLGAVESYQSAIHLSPNHFHLYCSLGQTFFKLDRLEDAANSFKRALQINEELFNLDGTAAIACEAIGFRTQASVHWRRFLQREPKSTLADLFRESKDELSQSVLEQKNNAQKTAQRQADFSKENELLLLQLHQVQEEIEVYFKKNKQLELLLSKWMEFSEECDEKLKVVSKESKDRM